MLILGKMPNIMPNLFSVVKEEISDDAASLPCFNGRVIAWVNLHYLFIELFILFSYYFYILFLLCL